MLCRSEWDRGIIFCIAGRKRRYEKRKEKDSRERIGEKE
jgi:hypothetical protein